MEPCNRTHRVGSLTTGFSLIGFGILCLLHSFLLRISYTTIFHLWPIIPIGLGVELLLSNCFKDRFLYDKGAIFLLFCMSFFAAGMAGVDLCFSYAQRVGW